MTEDIEMLQIQDTIVSLDIVERFFICDLGKCLGECCIEGDAGAPITREEYDKIKETLPEIWDDLMPQAKKVIEPSRPSTPSVRFTEFTMPTIATAAMI